MSNTARRNFIKSAIIVGATPLLSSANTIGENSLKFIHISDSHFDLENEFTVTSLKKIVSFINSDFKDLDFVLFGGDNYNKLNEAKSFKEIISKLNIPFYVVRGNKEASQKDFNKLFVNSKELVKNDRDWVLQKNGYMILGLDSSIEGANNGKYDNKTIKFAQNILDKKRPTIILNHHPYTNYWNGSEEKDLHKYVLNNTAEVQDKLFKYKNLVLTLSGHKHIDSVTKINDVKVIVTRASMRALDENNYPMRLIEMNNDKVSEKLIYTI